MKVVSYVTWVVVGLSIVSLTALAQDAFPGVWQAGDVGAMSPAGSTVYDTATGEFTMTAAGGALRNDTHPDAFQYLYHPVKGDFTVDLLITNNLTGRSALMIHNTLAARCRTVALYRNANKQFGFHSRLTDSGLGDNISGGSTVGGGKQHVMRLVRQGNRFTPYLRLLPDGEWFSPTWVNGNFSNGVEVAMDETVYVGVAMISSVSGTPQSVQVANINVFDCLNPSCTVQNDDLVMVWGAVSEAARYTLETRLSTNEVWQQVLDVSAPVAFRTKAVAMTHLFKVTAWDHAGVALEIREIVGTYDLHGLRGLYLDRLSALPRLIRHDATIDFNWGAAAPAPEVPRNMFKILWLGDVIAPITGTYSFYLTSTDGSRLYVGNTKVIDQWGHGSFYGSNTINLAQGQRYPIEVDYFENSRTNALCKLEWSVEEQIDRQVVPQDALRIFPWPWQRANLTSEASGNTEYDFSNNVIRLTMRSSGSELGTTGADGMHFAWQTVYGDCEISARIVALEGGAAWAKAVLAVRENASAGARSVMLAQRPGDCRMALLWRPTINTAGGSAGTALPAPAYFQTNKWMRLVKKGTTVNAYYRFTETEPWIQTDLPTKSYTLPDDLSPRAGCVGIGMSGRGGGVVTGVLDNIVLRSGPAAPSAERLASGEVAVKWLNAGQSASNVISRATAKNGPYDFLASTPFYATDYVDLFAPGGLCYYKVTACYPDNIACDSAYASTGGFYTEYYGSIQNRPYAYFMRSGIEPQINQVYDTGVIPLPGMLPDEYFMMWQAWFTPPASATYTFTANARERLRLWVDGQLVTNLWTDGNYTVAATVPLTQGRSVALRFVWYKYLSAGRAQLRYHTDQDPTLKFVDEQVSDPLMPLPADAAWQTTDIGNVPYGGRVRADAAGTRFLVRGSGKYMAPEDRPSGGDALSYVWQAAKSCAELSFRVSNYGFPMHYPCTNAMAGVMFRESMNTMAEYVFAGVDGGGNILFYKNSGAGVESLAEIVNPLSPAPRTARFKIIKRGRVVTAWYMIDTDTVWQTLGSTTFNARDVLVGLAVSDKLYDNRFVDAAFEDVMYRELRGTVIILH